MVSPAPELKPPSELRLDLPLGARLLVFAGLRLGTVATDASRQAEEALANAVRSWDGPGVVVVAGDLFDFGNGGDDEDSAGGAVTKALGAHPALVSVLNSFAAAVGRRVVVVPGRRDAWLWRSAVAASALRDRVGAELAPAIAVEMHTGTAIRRVRVEPGTRGGGEVDRVDKLGAPRGSESLAGVVPGLWRGSTGGWLAGMDELDDPAAAPRFVASRLVYRQLGRRAWLLVLPVLATVLALRLPLAFLRPSRLVSGLVLAATIAVAAVELLVLGALLAASLRHVWLALSSKAAGPRDLNETDRALARQMASEGLAGLVAAGPGPAELSAQGSGFYANPGRCSDVVSERVPRFGPLGLPSPFLAFRQCGWVELEAGNELHARLLHGEVALPGATLAEHLLTRRQRLGPPVLVASFPHGPSWPAQLSYRVPHRRARRLAATVVAAAGFMSLVIALSAPLAHRLGTLRQFLPLVVPQAAGVLASLAG
ncbi:MAG TPA: hypothetical protein VED59_09015, partial [Acidimicrobiales bacterium]|nr:hypothetical protein [Acidimicrobiales bacterium]